MRPSPGLRGGFSLLELMIVLTIVAFTATMGFQAYGKFAAEEKRDVTLARLATIEEALILFVSRAGRLPCPADLSLPNGTNGAGSAAGGPDACPTGRANSGVPWRDLELAYTDSLDGWGNAITYRVFTNAGANTGGFTRTNGLDMRACRAAAGDDTPLNAAPCAATRTPIAFLAQKGLRVLSAATGGQVLRNPADAASGGGAAFALISHGPDGAGAATRSGSFLPIVACQADQGENVDEDDDFVLRRDVGGDPTACTHFDDLVRAPTAHDVAARAGMGPDQP